MKITLDPDKVTLGDLEDFEDASGQDLDRVLASVDESGAVQNMRMKTVLALVWVFGRKTDPSLTLDQVRAWPMSELDGLEVEVAAEPDPTTGSV